MDDTFILLISPSKSFTYPTEQTESNESIVSSATAASSTSLHNTPGQHDDGLDADGHEEATVSNRTAADDDAAIADSNAATRPLHASSTNVNPVSTHPSATDPTSTDTDRVQAAAPDCPAVESDSGDSKACAHASNPSLATDNDIDTLDYISDAIHAPVGSMPDSSLTQDVTPAVANQPAVSRRSDTTLPAVKSVTDAADSPGSFLRTQRVHLGPSRVQPAAAPTSVSSATAATGHSIATALGRLLRPLSRSGLDYLAAAMDTSGSAESTPVNGLNSTPVTSNPSRSQSVHHFCIREALLPGRAWRLSPAMAATMAGASGALTETARPVRPQLAVSLPRARLGPDAKADSHTHSGAGGGTTASAKMGSGASTAASQGSGTITSALDTKQRTRPPKELYAPGDVAAHIAAVYATGKPSLLRDGVGTSATPASAGEALFLGSTWHASAHSATLGLSMADLAAEIGSLAPVSTAPLLLPEGPFLPSALAEEEALSEKLEQPIPKVGTLTSRQGAADGDGRVLDTVRRLLKAARSSNAMAGTADDDASLAKAADRAALATTDTPAAVAALETSGITTAEGDSDSDPATSTSQQSVAKDGSSTSLSSTTTVRPRVAPTVVVAATEAERQRIAAGLAKLEEFEHTMRGLEARARLWTERQGEPPLAAPIFDTLFASTTAPPPGDEDAETSASASTHALATAVAPTTEDTPRGALRHDKSRTSTSGISPRIRRRSRASLTLTLAPTASADMVAKPSSTLASQGHAVLPPITPEPTPSVTPASAAATLATATDNDDSATAVETVAVVAGTPAGSSEANTTTTGSNAAGAGSRVSSASRTTRAVPTAHRRRRSGWDVLLERQLATSANTRRGRDRDAVAVLEASAPPLDVEQGFTQLKTMLVELMELKLSEASGNILLDFDRKRVYTLHQQLGLLYYLLGHLPEALTHCDSAIALLPRDADARWVKHVVLRAMGDTDSALAVLEELSALAGDYRVYRAQGDLLFHDERWRDAARAYANALLYNSRDIHAVFHQGLAEEASGQPQAAMQAFLLVLELDPGHREARRRHADISLARGSARPAIRGYSSLLLETPADADLYFQRAQAHMHNRDLLAALQDLTQCVHLAPEHSAAFYLRGTLLARAKPTRALRDFGTLLLLEEEDSALTTQVYLQRGVVYAARKQPELALADFEMCLQQAPPPAPLSVETYYQMGLVHLHLRGRLARAITNFSRALVVEPTCTRALMARAAAFVELDRRDRVAGKRAGQRPDVQTEDAAVAEAAATAAAAQVAEDVAALLAVTRDASSGHHNERQGGELALRLEGDQSLAARAASAASEGASAAKSSLPAMRPSRAALERALCDYVRLVHMDPQCVEFRLLCGRTALALGQPVLAEQQLRAARATAAQPLGRRPLVQMQTDVLLGNTGVAIETLCKRLWPAPAAPTGPASDPVAAAAAAAANAAHAAALRTVHRPGSLLSRLRIAATPGRAQAELMARDRFLEPLVSALVAARRYEEAVAVLEVIVGAGQATSGTLLAMGECCTSLGNDQLAIEVLTAALRLSPRLAQAWYRRGVAHLRLGHGRSAAHDLAKAVELEPTLWQALLTRASLFALQRRYPKAILNCNQALRLQPRSTRILLTRGCLKALNGTLERALEDLEAAATLDQGRSPLITFNRGLVLHRLGRYRAALVDYDNTLASGASIAPVVRLNRALAHMALLDYKAAFADLRALLETTVAAGGLGVDGVGSASGAGAGLESDADADETDRTRATHSVAAAVTVTAAAVLSAAPPATHVLHTMALCCHRGGDVRGAVELYCRALDLDPQFVAGYIGRGNALLDIGTAQCWTLCRRDYTRALRCDPLRADAYLNLGIGLQARGQLQLAHRILSQGIVLWPRHAALREARGVVNLQALDLHAAYLDLCAAVAAPGGVSAAVLNTRGVVQLYMHDAAAAMHDFQAAIQQAPTESLPLFNAANVYLAKRQLRQALDLYDRAIALAGGEDSVRLDPGWLVNRALCKAAHGRPRQALVDVALAARRLGVVLPTSSDTSDTSDSSGSSGNSALAGDGQLAVGPERKTDGDDTAQKDVLWNAALLHLRVMVDTAAKDEAEARNAAAAAWHALNAYCRLCPDDAQAQHQRVLVQAEAEARNGRAQRV